MFEQIFKSVFVRSGKDPRSAGAAGSGIVAVQNTPLVGIGLHIHICIELDSLGYRVKKDEKDLGCAGRWVRAGVVWW